MGAVYTEKIRILIVEDEAIVAEDLELAVTNIGYEVVGRAVSADAAVDKAVKLKPDLILMDIVLRGEKNGIDASREIKDKVDIPVIFLTAPDCSLALKVNLPTWVAPSICTSTKS